VPPRSLAQIAAGFRPAGQRATPTGFFRVRLLLSLLLVDRRPFTMPAVPSYSDSANGGASSLAWIKADFHLHTAEDPCDDVNYTALELLELAQAKGFGALAVTLHHHVFHDERVFARARELGILMIPAAELRIESADVVVLNITPEEAAGIASFDDLRELRASRGDTIFMFAPHPYYILGGSIGERAEQHIDCFDAIEFCHFHIPLFNPNRRAARLAEAHGKPLLATSDSHRRQFFGENYSFIGIPEGEGIPSIEHVFAGMRAGRIRRVSPSGGLARTVSLLLFVLVVSPIIRRLPGSKRSLARQRRETAGAREPELAAAGATSQIDPSANL
jgi:hypothetical protein